MVNELKFGYNARPAPSARQRPASRSFNLNLSGSVGNTAIAGQGESSGLTIPAVWSGQ